jgi:DNA repair protein RecO (recombination protein O)
MTSINTDRGYVLHLRPYRENSGLINIFTHKYGRFIAVAYGIHKAAKRSLYQLFVPIICTWKGKGDLKQIKSLEIDTLQPNLTGKQLIWGLYLNELVCKLIPTHDPYETAFEAYEECLIALSKSSDERALRYFELSLIESLGYALPDSLPDEITHYNYFPNHGLCPSNVDGIPKEHIQALTDHKLTTTQELQSSKVLLKSIINTLLGNQSIQTRKLVTPWCSTPLNKE